jgi:AraC-like DNA-binding protein
MKYEPSAGKYLIQLLKASLYDETPENLPEHCSWTSVYELADLHSVAGMSCYAVLRLPDEQRPEGELLKKWIQTMQFTQARESMQHFECTAFFDLLEEGQIPFLPLKGWHIKHLYPRPDMRSMCDIDVLVRKEDMETASELLHKCGFHSNSQWNTNHIGFLKPPHIALELHHSLFYEDISYYDYFADYID